MRHVINYFNIKHIQKHLVVYIVLSIIIVFLLTLPFVYFRHASANELDPSLELKVTKVTEDTVTLTLADFKKEDYYLLYVNDNYREWMSESEHTVASLDTSKPLSFYVKTPDMIRKSNTASTSENNEVEGNPQDVKKDAFSIDLSMTKGTDGDVQLDWQDKESSLVYFVYVDNQFYSFSIRKKIKIIGIDDKTDHVFYVQAADTSRKSNVVSNKKSPTTQTSPSQPAATLPIGAQSKITIDAIDDTSQALQVTIDQKEQQFLLKMEGVENPQFQLLSNNNAIIKYEIVEGSKLKLTGLSEGRASLKIVERSTQEERYIGVRVRTKDGQLPGMPQYVSIGSVSEDTDADLNFFRGFGKGLTNKRMDIRYIYINGGPINGWRSWGENGSRAVNYIRESKKLGMIPFFVYYNIPDGGESYDTDLAHIQDGAYMKAYYEDLKYLLDITAREAGDDMVGFVLEPDFLGYMMQGSGKTPEEISAQVSAAYSSGVLEKGKDPDFADTLKGLVESINYIIRKNLPNAYFGWQFNLWAYNHAPAQGIVHFTDDEGLNKGRQSIVEGASAIAEYYMKAGVTSHGANFVSIDKYGLDAGAEPGAADDPAKSRWFWNADHWNNYLLFNKTIVDKTKLPMILWQIPVGHINGSQMPNPYQNGVFPDLPNTDKKYEDSAPVFFFGDAFKAGNTSRTVHFNANLSNDPKVKDGVWESHMEEVRDAGIISILFGAGVGSSTDGVGSPATDDNWWITKVQEYFKSPVLLR